MTGIFGRATQNPRTTLAGALIALTSVLGVLQQHGVSLGHVGAGTGISLATALATALLGVMAKD